MSVPLLDRSSGGWHSLYPSSYSPLGAFIPLRGVPTPLKLTVQYMVTRGRGFSGVQGVRLSGMFSVLLLRPRGWLESCECYGHRQECLCYLRPALKRRVSLSCH